MTQPLISVIMAVRNGASTIDEQLAGLARQTMREPWELIVVDNGSLDSTVERVLGWGDHLPVLRLLTSPAENRQPGALNRGVQAARAERIAFCDADDVVSDGWVEAMCQALETYVHVTGPLDLTRLNPAALLWGEHVELWQKGPLQHSFLPYAMGCNAGWRRDVILSLGGFVEHMAPGHDRDLSWRAQLSGHELWFASGALVHRRQRHTVLAAMRQTIGSGRSETRMVARFAGYGTCRRSVWQSTRPWLELAARLPWLLRYKYRIRWAEMAGAQIGLTWPLSQRERHNLRLSPAIRAPHPTPTHTARAG